MFVQVEDKDLSSSDCRHTVFVEETVSSLVCILAYLSKIRWLSCVSFSLGPLFYPTAARVCLCARAMLLSLLWLGSITYGRGSLRCHSLCSGLLWVSGYFMVPHEFKGPLSLFLWKIMLEYRWRMHLSVDRFWQDSCLYNIIFSNPWAWGCFSVC